MIPHTHLHGGQITAANVKLVETEWSNFVTPDSKVTRATYVVRTTAKAFF